MKNDIEYFNMVIVYHKGSKVKFKDYIFKAKQKTMGNVPPEFPLLENSHWILESECGHINKVYDFKE